MAVIGQQLENPESGWKRITHDNENLIYIGSWDRLNVDIPGMCPCLTTNSLAKIKFYFKGSNFRYVTGRVSYTTTEINVTIDKTIQEHFSLTGTAEYVDYLVYEKTGLTDTFHEVEISIGEGDDSKILIFTYLDIGNTDYLMSYSDFLKYTAVYLINDNGVYKNYDGNTNSLVEVNDLSILHESYENNICIKNLSTIIPFIDDLSSNVKFLSNRDNEITINGILNNNELIVSNNDTPFTIQENINYIQSNCETLNGGEVKFVFSIDGGNTWKTHNGLDFIDMTIVIPNKPYKELTSEEMLQWDTAKNMILLEGIKSSMLKTLDFNTITFDKIRFASVLHVDTGNDIALNKNLICCFDAKGSFQLMKDDEVDIKITSSSIIVTPKIDSELIKLNISTNGISQNINVENLDIDSLTTEQIDKLKTKLGL